MIRLDKRSPRIQFMKMAWLRQHDREAYQAYFLIPICVLLSIYPMFHWGFPQGHDFILELVRVAEYAHSLRAGIFPVRWGANLEGGYGYPIYNFFPPLFPALASLFVISSGLTVLTAIKLALLLLTLAGGVGMYLFTKQHFSRDAATLSACLYILAPYHFIDVFVRNAFAEFTALAIAPFVFYSLARILKSPHRAPASQVALAISSSLLMLSHLLSVAMFLPIFFGYFLIGTATTQRWEKWQQIALPLSLAFLLTAFFTLPLLFEQKFVQIWMLTQGPHFDVLLNLKSLPQLMAHWLTPFSGVLILLSCALLVATHKKIPGSDFTLFSFFAIALAGLLFLITPPSKAIWENLEFLKLLQFPWRLLSPATFITCLLPGVLSYLPNVRPRKILIHGLLFLGMLTITTLSLVLPREYADVRDDALSPQAIRTHWLRTTVLSEYLPLWAKPMHQATLGERLFSNTPDASISQIKTSPNHYSYHVSASHSTLFTARLFYFPGWAVYSNHHEVPVSPSKQGLLQFSLPAGTYLVELKFENTPVRTLGNSLSLLGLLLLAYQAYLSFRQYWAASKSCP